MVVLVRKNSLSTIIILCTMNHGVLYCSFNLAYSQPCLIISVSVGLGGIYSTNQIAPNRLN